MPRASVHAHQCSSLEEIQRGARNVRSLIPLPGSGDRQTGKWSLKKQILGSEVA